MRRGGRSCTPEGWAGGGAVSVGKATAAPSTAAAAMTSLMNGAIEQEVMPTVQPSMDPFDASVWPIGFVETVSCGLTFSSPAGAAWTACVWAPLSICTVGAEGPKQWATSARAPRSGSTRTNSITSRKRRVFTGVRAQRCGKNAHRERVCRCPARHLDRDQESNFGFSRCPMAFLAQGLRRNSGWMPPWPGMLRFDIVFAAAGKFSWWVSPGMRSRAASEWCYSLPLHKNLGG